MKIKITNCNNIDEGEIELEERKLNIKYAINGTGKSSISKGLEAFIKNDDSLKKSLLPFKYYGKENVDEPSILGTDNIRSVAIFNEGYVNSYVYQPNELIKNSFEIFVKNDEYEKNSKQIADLLQSVNATFNNHPELDELINSFQNFIDGFGKAKSGYSSAGVIGKGIGKGNKINNIPEDLKDYSIFLKDSKNVKWIKWHLEGKEYLNISNDKCPYCINKLDGTVVQKIQKVSDEYDAKWIENLNKMLNIFEFLNPYFSDETKGKIKEIEENISVISDEQKNYLIEVKMQVENLLEQLIGLKSIGFHSLKESENIKEDLSKYLIKVQYYSHLDSEITNEKIAVINDTISDVLLKVEELQGKINIHKKQIKKTIEMYNTEINNFLLYAGYKYQVSIEYDKVNNYHLVLRHRDCQSNIQAAASHLSYGEKNAFALVLFMYEVLKTNPDLVILDDPISSFDGNKKFAILNMLFMGERSFKDRTVLLLTHEFSTVIDAIKNMKSKICPSPTASFISTKNGILVEKPIRNFDIKSFVDIAKSNINSDIDCLNKLVYLRRWQEIRNKESLLYQLVSNIFHKRAEPKIKSIDKKSGECIDRKMSSEEINEAQEEVRKYIKDFSYKTEFEKTQNPKLLKQLYMNSGSNYEKMQIYRIAFNENHENDVIRKFINETFHVENDYLFQLDPREFDTVPQYVIDECDKEMQKIGECS